MLKKIFKHIFRYRIAAICFIVGQMIVYLAVFGAIDIYNVADIKEQDRIQSIYNNRIKIDVNSAYKSDVLTNVGEGVGVGNILLAGRLNVTFDEANSLNRAEMLLEVNEPLPYTLISGHIPGMEQSDIGQNVVALGRDKYKYSYEREGKQYVTLCMEEYEVVGVIGSDSDFWDYKILFNIDCIGDKTLQYLCEQSSYEIQFSSNEEDIAQLQHTYETIYKNMMMKDERIAVEASIDKSQGKSTVPTVYAKMQIRINYVVYAFCVINMVLVSYFWMITRKKEIAIRKAFGCSNLKIISMLMVEMLESMLFALVLFLFLYGVGVHWFNELIHIYLNWNTLTGIVLISIVTSIISMIYPACQVMKMNSSQGVIAK